MQNRAIFPAAIGGATRGVAYDCVPVRPPLPALLVFAFASTISTLRAADPLAEPNAPAVIAAIEAADGLSALSELDLAVLERDGNRDHFTETTLDGGTLAEARQRQRERTEQTVLAMGEVSGKHAELALRIRELWHLGDAEAALVTGAEPIDDAFRDRAKELRGKTAVLRIQMRRLLPPGVELADPADGPP